MTITRHMLTCAAIRHAGIEFECCESCHDDDEAGYGPMCEQYPEYEIESRNKKSMFFAHVCCNAPELDTVEKWAKVAWHYRQKLKEWRLTNAR